MTFFCLCEDKLLHTSDNNPITTSSFNNFPTKFSMNGNEKCFRLPSQRDATKCYHQKRKRATMGRVQTREQAFSQIHRNPNAKGIWGVASNSIVMLSFLERKQQVSFVLLCPALSIIRHVVIHNYSYTVCVFKEQVSLCVHHQLEAGISQQQSDNAATSLQPGHRQEIVFWLKYSSIG